MVLEKFRALRVAPKLSINPNRNPLALMSAELESEVEVEVEVEA